jgi:hypothetical protein
MDHDRRAPAPAVVSNSDKQVRLLSASRLAFRDRRMSAVLKAFDAALLFRRPHVDIRQIVLAVPLDRDRKSVAA